MQRLPIFVRAAALAALLLLIGAPTAGAEIIFGRSGDLIAMNDDGSNQHVLVAWLKVPGMDDLRNPGVDPNGTTLAFDAETRSASCDVACVGIYSLSGGVLRRLSPPPSACRDGCTSLSTRPAVASDNEVLYEYGFVSGDGNHTGNQLMRRSAFGGDQTQIPTPCSANSFSGEVAHVAVNPFNPAQIAFANCHKSDGSGRRQVHVANRDGAGATARLEDDVDFQDVAFTLDGGFLLTNEDGDVPGIWASDISVDPAVTYHMLTEPAGIVFGAPREISGDRVAFVAENDIWTIPTTCGISTACTYPASATRLTTAGHATALTWTSQTIAPPSTSSPPPPFVPPPPPPLKTTPPTLSRFALSSKAFRAAKHGASIAKAKPTGTKISYSADEAEITTTFVVQKPGKGARKGRSCVKRTKKLKKAPSCTLYVAVGKFTRKDTAGANSFTFSGRIGGKTLKPGSYRLVATPRNAGGKAGKALTVNFRIIR